VRTPVIQVLGGLGLWILCLFPSVTPMSSQLKVVDNFKYLGLLISSKSGDNTEILHQLWLIFARTNVLLRKFNKCNRLQM